MRVKTQRADGFSFGEKIEIKIRIQLFEFRGKLDKNVGLMLQKRCVSPPACVCVCFRSLVSSQAGDRGRAVDAVMLSP